jgi:hypothetical protein
LIASIKEDALFRCFLRENLSMHFQKNHEKAEGLLTQQGFTKHYITDEKISEVEQNH